MAPTSKTVACDCRDRDGLKLAFPGLCLREIGPASASRVARKDKSLAPNSKHAFAPRPRWTLQNCWRAQSDDPLNYEFADGTLKPIKESH
jgi:hypothetical protein